MNKLGNLSPGASVPGECLESNFCLSFSGFVFLFVVGFVVAVLFGVFVCLFCCYYLCCGFLFFQMGWVKFSQIVKKSHFVLLIPVLRKCSWFSFRWKNICFVILNDVYVYLLRVWLLWSCTAEWLEGAVLFSQWPFVAAKSDNTTVRCSQWLSGCWAPGFLLVPRAWLMCCSCRILHIYMRGHDDDC